MLIFLATLSSAKIQDVELIAKDVDKDGDIVTATTDVIVYSQEYFITADRARYDMANEVVELFGNVNVLRGANETSKADYVKLDLKNGTNFASTNFMMNKEAEVWSQNDESCSDSEYYRTKGSIVSSCNVNDPDWHINYTSGKLNKESKFLHLFNPVFYVGDTPILYLPYFGFPTDKTRRTGLLIPEFGYSKDQGFYYKQPIYFAPYKSWDLQLDPQIRTKRGVGIYANFRFADSPYSYGEIRGGIFDNKRKYQRKHDLKNNIHRGFEFYYNRSKVLGHLIDANFKENLYINFMKINDLGYFDLIQEDGDDEDPLVKSKLNYYLTTEEHYGGIYGRYYLDTAKLNGGDFVKNKDTVQELPTLHYHKFTNSLYFDDLLYSIDLKYHNYTRSLGVEASQYEASVPLSYTSHLFDDYLNLTFGQNLYWTYIDYTDALSYENYELRKQKNDRFANQYFNISLSTDLVKPYESFFHTLNLNFDYIIPGFTSGDIESRLFKDYRYDKDVSLNRVNKWALDNPLNNYYYEDNFVTTAKTYEEQLLRAGLTQFFYDSDGKKRVRHSISDSYNLELDEFDELENRVDIYLDKFSIGNKLTYSHLYNEFSKVETYARYSDGTFSAYINHLYEKYRRDGGNQESYDKENFLTLNASVKLPQNYTIFATYKYDIENEYSKLWRVGITKNRKCWNYTIAYQEYIDPTTTNRAGYYKADKEKAVYFFVNFYPFGGVGYDYSHSSEYEPKS
ncbi:MAG: LPS-assembly protein LptD [Campylobacter sp.]|nr:LPS-assembly protein LptD [Campylobacter sp.]